MNDVAKVDSHSIVEKVVIQGDLAALTPAERLTYYKQVCDSVGLNPLTRPFEYIRLNNKLTLYAKRDATDQLRSIHGVSIKIVAREKVDDLYIVTAQAIDKSGRTDESVGAVNLKGLVGDAAANAIMKAETKAKRRVTLSIAGLGLLDETEVTTVPGAVMITPDPVDQDTVFKAVVWFKEMIEVDQVEENYQIVKAGWDKLSNNERMEVDAKLGDKIPSSNRMYRTVLKDYLNYVPEPSVPEAHK